MLHRLNENFNRIFTLAAAVILSVMILAFAGVMTHAEETDPGIGFSVFVPDGAGGFVSLQPVTEKDGIYLFLPSCASYNAVIFHYEPAALSLSFADGNVLAPDAPIDLTPFLSADTGNGKRVLSLILTGKDGTSSGLPLFVMRSENIPSVFLTSSDPKKGRSFVDENKFRKAEGAMTMLTSAGLPVYKGNLTQINSRGNTTFFAEKKAYQIKLGAKTDLTMTDPSNQNKTWILLANAFDPTLIHNTSAYRMAASFGLDAPDCIPVDLYYDGIYRGNYLLCEKVEIGKGRISIRDLEEENEKANPGKKIDDLPTASGTNGYGGFYQYVPGVQNPADIRGGYLLELDHIYYESERSYFITTTGIPFVVKSPESCSKEEMIYISEYVEEMLQASLNGGICPGNGKSVWDYIDKTSLSRYFVLQETAANADSFTSSAYFYLPADGRALMAGPVWDFDDSFGVREDKLSAGGFMGGTFILPFMNLPEFRKEVKSFTSSGTYRDASKGRTDIYAAEIAASEKMNRVLWMGKDESYLTHSTYAEDIAYMKNYQSRRLSALRGLWGGW